MTPLYIPNEVTSGHGTQRTATQLHTLRPRMVAAQDRDDGTETMPNLQESVLGSGTNATGDGPGDQEKGEETCEVELTFTERVSDDASLARLYEIMLELNR